MRLRKNRDLTAENTEEVRKIKVEAGGDVRLFRFKITVANEQKGVQP